MCQGAEGESDASFSELPAGPPGGSPHVDLLPQVPRRDLQPRQPLATGPLPQVQARSTVRSAHVRRAQGHGQIPRPARVLGPERQVYRPVRRREAWQGHSLHSSSERIAEGHFGQFGRRISLRPTSPHGRSHSAPPNDATAASSWRIHRASIFDPVPVRRAALCPPLCLPTGPASSGNAGRFPATLGCVAHACSVRTRDGWRVPAGQGALRDAGHAPRTFASISDSFARRALRARTSTFNCRDLTVGDASTILDFKSFYRLHFVYY